MSKFKCNECQHVWKSSQEPFECPECKCTNFEKVEEPKPWWRIAIIASVVFISLILLLRGCKDETVVKINADSEKCKLTVNIEGKYKNEYKIILRKDGVINGDVSKKDKAVFSDLNGTYTLEIQYIGKGKVPEINNYQKTHTFITPPEPPKTPQITSMTKTPNLLTQNVKVYTVTVNTDTGIVPINETEFSKDGTNWQSSNVFPQLPAGTYNFYARNANDETLQSSPMQLFLEDYKPVPPPTAARLNQLLSEIANNNQSAYDTFFNTLGGDLRVIGANNISNVQELANEAFISRRRFQVTSISTNSDGDVLSITVN
jgi:hypothetical protein